jgi:hypothetical protein
LNIGTVITYIIGTINEIRTAFAGLIVQNKPIESGKMSISCNTDSVRRRILQIRNEHMIELDALQLKLGTYTTTRRLHAADSNSMRVYGDASADGRFTLADLIFVQEYYNQAPVLGCASAGGDMCTNRSSLSIWQHAQISPVNESMSGARDIPYIIGVFLQRFHFVTNVSFVSSENTLKLQVRLIQKNGMPVKSLNTRVLFVLNSRYSSLPWIDALHTPSYDSVNALISVYAALCTTCDEDGWFSVTANGVDINTRIIGQQGSYCLYFVSLFI